MPRDIFRSQSARLAPNLLQRRGAVTPRTRRATTTVRAEPRSHAYLAALRQIDVHVDISTMDHAAIAASIHAEFDPIMDTLPIGFVAKCYLGAPYRVHALDGLGRIIEHYAANDPMSPDLERGRKLAENPAYAVIEIYPDKIVAIRTDGTPLTVTG